ncbi:MAG: HEAT repeat domain-containing protein [Cyanobacteria bacterium P01_A01_bin.105]
MIEMEKHWQQRHAAVAAADSAQGLTDAVESLAELADPRSVPTLIQVLGFNNPGAAVAAVDGLIAIGVTAVEPLLAKLDGYNYGARAWAIRALAGIGDPRGQSLLLDAAATDFAMSVRRAAARGLGNLRWTDLPINQRYDRWQQSQQQLMTVVQDEEWVVRYAAVVGLETLALDGQVAIPALPPCDCQAIVSTLETLVQQDPRPAVQARAAWAVQQLGQE